MLDVLKRWYQTRFSDPDAVALFLLLVLALAVGTFSRFYLVSWIGERCVADIRRAVFDHLIGLHPGFFEDNRSSEIQSRLTADTTLLQSVIGSSLSMFLRNALMVIGGVVLLFITNPKLTSIVVVALPLVLAPILLFGRRVRSLSRQSQDRVADVGSYVAETLGQIKTVQAYNHQAHDRQLFAGTVEAAFAVARQRIAQRAWLITLVIVLVLGAVGVMLWVGGMDVIAGRISAGELAAFVFYSLIVGSAFGTLSEVIGELQRAAGAAERIAEPIKAVSWNIRLDTPHDAELAWPHRAGNVIRQLQQQQPDIVGLQEVMLHQLVRIESAMPGFQRRAKTRWLHRPPHGRSVTVRPWPPRAPRQPAAVRHSAAA